ncbi:MAG TPA: DUF4129 domain-containing protein [Methylomirabilota bacterium]|jgi:hypothetical protein|nr:DUF4129 domain-containing protein [Methylomirabilota bacterium]
MVLGVSPALIWTPLAASFVIGLAGVLRMAGPIAGGGDDLTGVIRLPQPVTATILTLFALAAVVFLTDLGRRWLSRRRSDDEAARAPEIPQTPAWLRALTLILSILNIAVIAYLLWRGVIPFGGLLSFGSGAGPAPGLPLTLPRSAPPVITWTFGILAVTAGLGALALAVRFALGDRLAERRANTAGAAPAGPLEAAVEDSLEDLSSEPDARRAIVRCYARFERVASNSGVERKPWLTPMEFTREVLSRLPLPRTAVPTLTSLFELARFSHHPLGSTERDRAVEALHEIRTAVETADAGAR